MKIAKWKPEQCNDLAIALLDDKAGKDGVELLKEFLNDGKLPQFQLQGENGYGASRKKALELLGKDTTEDIAELRGLI